MKPLLTLIGLITITFSTMFIHSCEFNNFHGGIDEELLGSWEVSSYTINAQEQIGANFQSVALHFDPAGSASWLLTDLKGKTEAVVGNYTIQKDGYDYTLKFIEPSFDIVLANELHLAGKAKNGRLHHIEAHKK